MMYVLMQLDDTYAPIGFDQPIRVASSSNDLLSWFRMENRNHEMRNFSSGDSCSPGIVWSVLLKKENRPTVEFACWEVPKI